MERRTAMTLIIGLIAWLCFAVPAMAAEPMAANPMAANPMAAKQSATSDGANASTRTIATPASSKVPSPPVASPKAVRYYKSGNVLWFLGIAWGFLVPGVILFTGFSARLRDFATRIGKYWYVSLVAYLVLLSCVFFVVNFPLDYYTSYLRPHDYGLSSQAFTKWLGDDFKALGVSLVFGALFIWIPYLLLRKATKRWWLYTAAASLPIVVFMLIVSPIWISPMFNKFGPMKDKALESQIVSLANRAGIENARIFEVNKSVDTKQVNAYVTGVGHTKRIVLWDTIIAALTPSQLLVVMGHEMGHYVLGHVWETLLFSTVLSFLSLWLIHRTSGWVLEKYGERFGFNALGDFASLPLLMIMLNFFTFFMVPLALANSRHNEHEADRFALEITHDNASCAAAFVKLSDENLAYPRPGWLYKIWRSSHPPVGERYDFCLSYHPWTEGKPSKYAGYFN